MSVSASIATTLLDRSPKQNIFDEIISKSLHLAKCRTRLQRRKFSNVDCAENDRYDALHSLDNAKAMWNMPQRAQTYSFSFQHQSGIKGGQSGLHAG